MSAGGAPIEWDFTLVPFAPLIVRLLDAVAPEVVIEVGADQGDFTRELLRWASGRRVEVIAVDPEPGPGLIELAEQQRLDQGTTLRLVREPSPAALRGLPSPGAIVLDGDHNYYTLSEELRLIKERSLESGLPLLLVHDVGWPHARRDTYYSPERVPEGDRQPLAEDVRVAPGVPGAVNTGVIFRWAAEREGGPRNGVLTAVEDFVEARPEIQMGMIPAFFGLAALWSARAPWARAVEALMAPWESSPMLARLEEVRVAHLIDHRRMELQEEQLRAMLNSRAFTIAERIARVRDRGSPAISRDRIRRALED
jgi:hypothetical protein